MGITGLPNWLEQIGAPGLVVTGMLVVLTFIFSIYFALRAVELFRTTSGAGEHSGLLRIYGKRILYTLLAAALLTSGIALVAGSSSRAWLVAYILVVAMSGGAGAAELISRYRDSPARAISTTPAMFYILLNALAGIGALFLISIPQFAEKVGLPKGKWEDGDFATAVIIAGFASLLIFRTSLVKLRVGESDLAIGPSIVLDSLLIAADRSVDRLMAEPRAKFVHGLMGDLAFDKTVTILPGHCLALMQNVASEETQRIVGVVNSLRADKDTPDKIKALNLGLALLTTVGEKVLDTAVKGLKKELQDSTAQLLAEVTKVMRDISFDKARRTLPAYCFMLWPKSIPDDVQTKFSAEATALGALQDVTDDYKALMLGIRLAKVTDGDTLRKAVEDLGASITSPRALPAPAMVPQAQPESAGT